MNRIFLSKSRYCNCIQCPKMLWLKQYKREQAVQKADPAVFETGKKVGVLAQDLFGRKHYDIHYNGNFRQMEEKTREYLQNKPNIITEATFNYNNNFCMVDILKNDTDGVEIYEVKSSTKIKPIYEDDAAFQYYVLSNMGLNVKKVCIIYINKEYIRENDLKLDELFNIEDITGIVIEKQDEIRNNINIINDFMKKHDRNNEPDISLGIHCINPYECDFWEYCTRNLPEPNIFDINGGMKNETKFNKYNEGIISFEQLQYEKDLNPKYLEQIDFELNNREPKIDKEAIKDLMDSLKYPLYFLDYETYFPAIPEFEKTRPYQHVPFQYSLHIIQEECAPLEHKEYLAQHDDPDLIRHFAENLIKDLPEDGNVIIYNKAFEPTRNKEIGEMYPDLKEEMIRINNNMVDFMIPFKQRNYYTKEMQGSYSIKQVLPALYPEDSSLNYSNLQAIHDGSQASNAFKNLTNKSPEEQEKIRKQLLEYCKLDTYALVKIYEKFKKIIG